MSWRVRKSINLGGGMRVNLSKSGPSFSFGRRGARVTVGKRGVTRTLGIPGTGIYNTKTTGWGKKKTVKARPRQTYSPGAVNSPQPSKLPEITADNFTFLNVPPRGSGKIALLTYLPLVLALVFMAAACAAWPFVFLSFALLVFAVVNFIRFRKKLNAFHWISQAMQKYPHNQAEALQLIHRAEPLLPENAAVQAFLGMECLSLGDEESARKHFSGLPEIYRNDKTIAHILGVEQPALSAQSAEPVLKAPDSVPLVTSQGNLSLISATNPVFPPEPAQITVQGKPDTEYSITVKFDSSVSRAKGLEPQVSDHSGKVSWTWKIRSSCRYADITISDGSDSLHIALEIC